MRRKFALILVLLVASGLSAAAQNRLLTAQPATSPMTHVSARLLPPPAPTKPDSLNRVTLRASSKHLHSSIFESSMDSMETPFVQQVHVPVATLGNARFRLEGFSRLRPMENILWGPPGAGNLPAWSVATQAHPGVWAPMADQSYGLIVMFRLQSEGQPEARLPAWRYLAKLLRARGSSGSH